MGRPRLENPRRLPRHLRNEDIPTNTFTPRAYQVELLDAAVQQNSIICLGSNTGKTFIAVMVLRELSHQVRQPLSQNGKCSVYVINNENHLLEKSKIIEHHTDLIVGLYTSDDHTDQWTDEVWTQNVIHKQILITTPKILCNMLDRSVVNSSQLNVVIFEDCHHALGDEFYNKVIEHLQSCPESTGPRILGLTSCFLSSKCQDPVQLEQSIRSLERKLGCTAETATLVMSERYGLKPKELVFECDNYDDTTGMIETLGSILESSLHFLQDYNMQIDDDDDDEDDDGRDPTQIPKTAITECLNILYRLGPWCAAHIAQMLVTQLEKIDKHERVGIHKKFLKYCATQLRLISAMFEQDFKPNYDVEELLSYTAPKVRKLINHLRKFKPNCDFMIISSEEMDGEIDDLDDDSFLSDDSSDFIDSDEEHDEKSRSPKLIHIAVKKEPSEPEVKKTFDPLFTEENPYLCGIVFVDQKYVALALNKFIEEVCSWDDGLCFVKSHHISAHGQKGTATKKDGGKTNKKQEEILRKFRLQELNLLISTNVLEDGIDLPKCNLVVKFDSPKDYRSYCQSKGRARARDAEYVLLVEEFALESFRNDIRMFKGIEDVLTGQCRNKGDNSEVCPGDEGNDDDESLYQDVLPPYSPGEGCPSVSLNNAIPLVNRYCAKLPSDAFTHLTPHCTIQHVTDVDPPVYIASLRLPINSPIKDHIQGNPMPNERLAKKAVALKMCEILHKAGELDEQLMPVGKELFIMEEEDNSGELCEEDVSGEARPGTTKRKQYYLKKIASALIQSHPKASDENFIFILNLKLTKPISDDQNTRGRKIYDPEENSSTFGLVTSNEIPQIPQFPVYTRSGEVTVSISLLKSGVAFSEENLTKFREFHEFVFSNVLRLEKDPMDFSPEQADVGYLMVPLIRDDKHSDWKIDFEFMIKVQKSKFVKKRNIYDSKEDEFLFDESEYDDAVVMPAYRNIDQPQHFYVAEIRYDLNPISPFPSPELYKTFSEYYNAKYGLTITNLEQPLLDVDHTSARLNLLTPRYMNQKGVALPTSSAETKKARRENLQQKQILVPELCEVHVFPASLWRIAVCLPAVMYRTNYLLVAEEIRIKIALETGIGVSQIPEGFSFPPLDFGFQETGSILDNEGNVEKDDESQESADVDSDQSEKIKMETLGTSDDMSSCENTKMDSDELDKTKTESLDTKDDVSCNTTKMDSDELDKNKMESLDTKDDVSCNTTKMHSVELDKTKMESLDTKDNVSCNITKMDSDKLDETKMESSDINHDASSCKNTKNDANKCNCVLSSSSDVHAVKTCHCNNDSVSESKQDTPEHRTQDKHISDLISDFNDLNKSKCKCCSNVSDKNGYINSLPHDQEFIQEKSREVCVNCLSHDQEKSMEDCVNCLSHDQEFIPEKAREDCVNCLSLDQEFIQEKTMEDCVSFCDCSIVQSKGKGALITEKQEYNSQTNEMIQNIENLTLSDTCIPTCAGDHHKDDDTTQTDSVPNKCDNTEHSSVNSNMSCVGAIDVSMETLERCNIESEHNNVENETDIDMFSGVGHFGKDKIDKSKLPPSDMESEEFPEPLLSLDEDIDLGKYIGPSPCTILQALTMSNANDFFSLERLETIGDSFLKYAITVYLYCSYPGIHEGKLSYLRSKQVSNCNLYRLGKRKCLAECMISTKFEPYENWLPPGFVINEDKRKGPVPRVLLSGTSIKKEAELEKITCPKELHSRSSTNSDSDSMQNSFTEALEEIESEDGDQDEEVMENAPSQCLIPYSLQTLHSIPDKSIADCVESLIGCYLTSCGKKAALMFMSWLGLKVLPKRKKDKSQENDIEEIEIEDLNALKCPPSPLLCCSVSSTELLDHLLIGYEALEERIGYKFNDRSYLLQAFTHASYHYNTVTDCYQRLEFLGDAILDYVITRHLYEDSCKYSPGVLTDLRSALVNNNIFAALAVKWDFHKYFKAISPSLFHVIEKFVSRQKEREDEIDLDSDDEEDEEEGQERVELEVPKALGDIFESLAGAIYLDSGMSLDVVWRVYYRIMKPQIDKYLKSIPKSPVRELLEMEPETAKFERPERTLEGKIRVTVNVVGKGQFTGIGRNYRIAKSASAKKALRCIKTMQMQGLI